MMTTLGARASSGSVVHMRCQTHLINAYSLNPLASGIGVKFPMHPLNAGFLLERVCEVVFHVTNSALIISVPHRQASAPYISRSHKATYNGSSGFSNGGDIGSLPS